MEKNKNIGSDQEDFNAKIWSEIMHSKKSLDGLKNSIAWIDKKNASFDTKDIQDNEEMALQSIENSLWWTKEHKEIDISHSSKHDIVSEQLQHPMYIPPSVQEGKSDAVSSVENLIANAPKDTNRIAAGVGYWIKGIMDTEPVA